MKIWELNIKVYIIEDIYKDDAAGCISKVIDKSFLHNEKYSKFHEENKYKLYCFNSFYPLEKSGIYKKGNIYNILLRTVDDNLADYFCNNLVNEYTNKIKVLTINKRIIPQKQIEKLYSISPAVAKFKEGYWKSIYGVDVFEKRLKDNLIKKYNQFANTKIDEDFEFINHIEFINKKPIAVKYKGISVLGDKVSLKIAENKMAQELAYFAIGSGILEMCSRGCGFVGYRWL